MGFRKFVGFHVLVKLKPGVENTGTFGTPDGTAKVVEVEVTVNVVKFGEGNGLGGIWTQAAFVRYAVVCFDFVGF